MSASSCEAKVRQYKVKVVKEYPHDEMSYTQGLFFQGDRMIETTGQWGESTLRLVDLATGKALKKFDFDKKYFLEGSVQLGDNIYILTWKNKVAFIYDAKTLAYKQTYSYAREGWGLTTDGKSLIASDGSARLYWLDEQLKQQKSLTVKMNGRPVNQLNELEWIDGRIWANVYMTDMIVIINPETGVVEATVDCNARTGCALLSARLVAAATGPAREKTCKSKFRLTSSAHGVRRYENRLSAEFSAERVTSSPPELGGEPEGRGGLKNGQCNNPR